MRYTALALFFTLLISGCGFKLRGSHDPFPAIFQHTYFSEGSTDNERLFKQVKQLIRLNGGKIVEQNQGKVAISLSPIQEDARQVALTGSGTLKEYERTYRVTVTLVDLDNHVQLGSRTLNVVRNIQLDDSKILAGEERSEVLRQTAERSLAQLIIQYLKSF